MPYQVVDIEDFDPNYLEVESWNEDVARVEVIGERIFVTGIREGYATIVVRYGDVVSLIEFTVNKDPDASAEYAITVQNIEGAGGRFIISWTDDVYAISTEDASIVKDFKFGVEPKNGNDPAIKLSSNLVLAGGDAVELPLAVTDIPTFDAANLAVSSSNEEVATVAVVEGKILVTGLTAGTTTITATYTDAENEVDVSDELELKGELTNKVAKVEFNKYLGYVAQDSTVPVIDGTTVTLVKPDDSAWAEWSCQLFLDVKAREGNIFEAGKIYIVSVTVESSENLNTCHWKFEGQPAYIDESNISYVAGEAKVLTKEFTATVNCELFDCLFSFPGAASTITISNFTVYEL